jgi:site-specific DNA recombinase
LRGRLQVDKCRNRGGNCQGIIKDIVIITVKSRNLRSCIVTSKLAVAYTRVSSKEQADKNLSLETQKKAIEEYACRSGITILAFFGGTYESAKTDGRKEFQRMQDYLKKNKGKIESILVYTIDRFSRTGGGAIKLAQDLREKLGVNVFAVTQPTDTNTASGIFQQNIHFLFSHYDNEQRKQKTIAGMREKLNRGDWIVRTPRGFDVIKVNGVRKIVINKEGDLIKTAFEWKSKRIKNETIIQKLKTRGLTIRKQELCKIFANPFYCGKIAHAMLDGRVVDGNQDRLISESLFLQVNEIRQLAAGYGVPHKMRQVELPLKIFLTCGDCGAHYTGYIVKSKGLYYYKCRTTGCKCNRSAKQLHEKFSSLLESYQLKPCLMSLLEKQLLMIHDQFRSSRANEFYELETRLAIQNKKIEELEEKFYLYEKMSTEVFERLHHKCKEGLLEIQKELGEYSENISNPQQTIKKAIQISSKLNTMWSSGSIEIKEKLQKLVFPEGISYDRKKEGFRTKRVNTIFELINLFSKALQGNKKGTNLSFENLSLSAEREGFEPPEV